MSGKGNWANIMLDYGYDLGSHYRGRLFYSVKSADVTNPKSSVEDLKFEFPRNPEPNSDEKTYILRLQVYEAVMLPQRKRCIFHFQIGPYLFKTEPVQVTSHSTTKSKSNLSFVRSLKEELRSTIHSLIKK